MFFLVDVCVLLLLKVTGTHLRRQNHATNIIFWGDWIGLQKENIIFANIL